MISAAAPDNQAAVLVSLDLGGAAPEDAAEELLRRYCTLVYADTGSYVEAAERLGLDRRTVKSRIDPVLLAQLR